MSDLGSNGGDSDIDGWDIASDSPTSPGDEATPSDEDISIYRVKTPFTFSCECGGIYFSNGNHMECDDCGNVSDMPYQECVSNLAKKVEGFTHEQRKSLTKRLTLLNKNAKERGIRPFAEAVINTAVDYFARLRETTEETRSQKMGARIAACLYRAAQYHECARPRKEIARFCKINGKLSSALNLISLQEAKGFTITGMGEKKQDSRRLLANTVFVRCGVTDDKSKKMLGDTLMYILKVSEEDHLISVSSMHDSKVTAASYIAMRLHGVPPNLDLDTVCSACNIHEDTLLKFINEVKKNIHLFDFGYIESVS